MQVKVWTDNGLRRFMDIRAKYDPEGIFPGFKAFLRNLELEKSSL